VPTAITTSSTTTDGTEQTLATDTTNKVYVFVVDTSAMAGGDAIEIRIYTKARSGDSSLLAYYVTYANAQGEVNKYSPPIPADIECKVTLKRVAGTDRAYKWALLSL